MTGRHRRHHSSAFITRTKSAIAGTLSISMLLAPTHIAQAQPEIPNKLFSEDINLPGFGHVPNPNPDALINGEPDYVQEAKPLSPEQQAASDNSPLNNFPLTPTRATNAGTLVSKEAGKMMVDDRLWNANTYRYHYNSTDSMGNPSVDTAIYIEPKTPWTGEGPRPVVAIAPGTQGSGEQCDPSIALQEGPSVRLDPFDLVFPYEFIPLADHLRRGAAVVMIDHHRNSAGNQDYVDNIASAQSLLDAVDAAKELGADANAPVGIYGYSQGGSAAAAAAERAGVYAPEINVVATSAGGPPSDLLQVLDQINGTALTAAIALAVNSVLDKDPALKEAVSSELSENGKSIIDNVGDYCVVGLATHHMFETTDRYSADRVKLATIIKQFAPIERELKRQKVGNFVPNAPVFLYSGTNDDVIPVEQARQLRDDWQALGFSNLTWKEDPTPAILQKTALNHVLPMLNNLDQATNFIWDHFPSQPAMQNLEL